MKFCSNILQLKQVIVLWLNIVKHLQIDKHKNQPQYEMYKNKTINVNITGLKSQIDLYYLTVNTIVKVAHSEAKIIIQKYI